MYEAINVFPGLNWLLSFNEGAAFGMLADSSGWQKIFFILVAVLISSVIIVWLKRLESSKKVEGLALVFILGGALGNLADRVRLGHVVDFIDVYYQDWHWYTFNVADSFICIGTFLLIVLIFSKKH